MLVNLLAIIIALQAKAIDDLIVPHFRHRPRCPRGVAVLRLGSIKEGLGPWAPATIIWIKRTHASD